MLIPVLKWRETNKTTSRATVPVRSTRYSYGGLLLATAWISVLQNGDLKEGEDDDEDEGH